eukprot:m.65080 g.65080  ORF g.65080 m.65080 type:complete len:203 (+) comp23516_c0_seq2:403-1011(+)
MVRCFLACSLVHPQVVLHSTQFTTDASTESLARSVDGMDSADRVRIQRQSDMDLLAERICSESTTSSEMKATRHVSPDPSVQGVNQGPVQVTEDGGVFRTRKGAPYSSQMLVHWKRAQNLAIALVRYPNENPMTVEMTLTTIARALGKHCSDVLQNPTELILHPEKVAAILHHHLPNGMLLLLNHTMGMQISAELDLFLAEH